MKGVNAVLNPVSALEHRLFRLAMAKLGGFLIVIEAGPTLKRNELRVSACQYRNRGGGSGSLAAQGCIMESVWDHDDCGPRD